MGQNVAAIVYGVEVTREQLAVLCEDGDWRKPFPKKCGRIETGTGDGMKLIGITIAVQNVPDDDEVKMVDCRISDIEVVYKRRLGQAGRLWYQVISKWAESQGVDLGTPELLLVTVERA